MANNFAPLVTVKQTSLEISQNRVLSSLFDYLDLDGNPLLKLRFRDNGSANTSGFFVRNGVKVAANQWIEVTAAELGSIHYYAGLIEAGETISVQAFDGKWGNIGTGTMLTVAQNFFAPVVSATNGSVLSNEVRTVAELISVTDQDGDAVANYQFIDRLTGALTGYFLFNGQKMASGQWFTVNPNDLDKLRFVSAAFGPFDENIGVRASDGKQWGNVVDFTMTTTANQFIPVVQAFNAQGRTGASVELRTLFTATDADNNTIKTLTIRDSGNAAASGYFTVNGVKQTQGEWFTIDYAQLDTVRYQYANQGEVEYFDIQAFDGRYVSSIQRGQVAATPRPDITADSELVFDALVEADLSNLFSKNDTGPNYTKYQFYDQNGDVDSAHLELNGTWLVQDRVYEFNANQLANLGLESAASDNGRTLDQIYVRANNGLYWTDWTRINVNTEPVANVALQTFGRWDNQTDGKTIVTYTFAENAPFYYAPDSNEVTTFSVIQPLARAAIRAIYDDIETYANVKFIEVPWTPGQGSDAKTVWGMNTQTGSQGYTYGPIRETGLGDLIGDIWISDAGPTAPDNPEQGVRGSYGWLTYYHEIGHSMGFDHPFNDGSNLPPWLPPWLDDRQVTIMSYTDSRLAPPTGPNSGYSTTFALYDIIEIQRLYGANTAHNADNTQYRWELTDNNLQAFWDGGEIDTVNFGNQVAPATIDLREGHYSSLNGRQNALTIPFGSVIENARGSKNNDTIIGNEVRNQIFSGTGDDIIQAMGGNDVLRGQAGHDTYVWGMGDGRDAIRESGGGVDTLEFRDLTGDFDALQNDISFWKTGGALRDLRVELTLNNGQSIGGVTIFDMQYGSGAVEKLRIVDKNGEQVGKVIDLTSVFVGATDQKQHFRVTDFQSSFGYIAVPV